MRCQRASDIQKSEKRTFQDIFERLNHAALTIDIVQAWYLDEPAHIVRVQLVVHNPASELVPFILRAPVDADAPFAILYQG